MLASNYLRQLRLPPNSTLRCDTREVHTVPISVSNLPSPAKPRQSSAASRPSLRPRTDLSTAAVFFFLSLGFLFSPLPNDRGRHHQVASNCRRSFDPIHSVVGSPSTRATGHSAIMALGRSLAGWMRLPTVIAALTFTWTATLAAADKAAGDYFVHSLPGAPEGPLVKMHAG